MSSNSGRVEDSVQYRSLGPRVEAGSGVRGYSRYAHPGPWPRRGGGLARGGGLHQPGCLLLRGGAQLGALHLAHLAQLEQVRSCRGRVFRRDLLRVCDSLSVCTSLTGLGPLDTVGLLGLVLGEHEVAVHGQEAVLLAGGGHLLLLLLGQRHA